MIADDTLFFCSPTYHNVLVIKAMLRSFELVSGLRVNFHKSTVGAELRILSKCLNSRLMGLPFKYLGMPKSLSLLSFFKAPVSVCNQIRRIQAQFLWGGAMIVLGKSEGETPGKQTRMKTGPNIQENDTTFNPKP